MPKPSDKKQPTPEWTADWLKAVMTAKDHGTEAESLNNEAIFEYEEGNWAGAAHRLRLAAEELFMQGENLAIAAGILEGDES